MFLFVCECCGAWEDKTLVDAWAKAWQPVVKAFANGLAKSYGLKVKEPPIEEPTSWPCPVNAEHGTMRAVSSEDRLFIQPTIVETTTEEVLAVAPCRVEPIRAGGSHEEN